MSNILRNQTILHLLIIVSLYFGFLISDAGLNYVCTAYAQATNSSFQSEASIIDNMSPKESKWVTQI